MKVKKVTELNRKTIDEYKQSPKTPLIVVLDNIRSLNNVGSIFRSSDSFLIEKIYLCGITATPPHADIHKTALGAEDSVEWEFVENIVELIKKLKSQGIQVFAVEQAHNSISLDRIALDKGSKHAVVLGNEVMGVSQEVVDVCDACVEIPQAGTKHSLNVAVAGGIILWKFYEKLVLS